MDPWEIEGDTSTDTEGKAPSNSYITINTPFGPARFPVYGVDPQTGQIILSPPTVINTPPPTYRSPDYYTNTGTKPPSYRDWLNLQGSTSALLGPSLNDLITWSLADAAGGAGGGGGGGAGMVQGGVMQYDPFSQKLSNAQLQEAIRQYNISAGLERAKYLQSVLSTPSNVFSSFFSSRGQVPPYNAQLANILNIPGQNQPFFGTMPDLGQTPGIPALPTPEAPQAIPYMPPYEVVRYAGGGTVIPPEPAVAIGLNSGRPLFTFNENAPQQTEKVTITPQVPSFQGGGTAYTNVWQPPLPPLPAPMQDVYDRGFPQFPYLTQVGQGQPLLFPDMGNATGMPVPSLPSLNNMSPSELESFKNYYETVLGVPAADVFWAAEQPFRNLRGATPAMNMSW